MTHRSGGRPVIAAIDGSEGSLRGARTAAEEARRRGAALELLTALPWSSLGMTRSPSAGDLPAAVLHNAESMLQEVSAGLAPVAGVGGVTWSVVERRPVDALRDASHAGTAARPGQPRRRGRRRSAGGVHRDRRRARRRVPGARPPDETSVTVSQRRSVVVGVEGRTGDEEVLGAAFDEAAARGTDLIAVHAWQDVRVGASFEVVSPLVDWPASWPTRSASWPRGLAGWREKQPDVVVREVVLRDRTAHALLAAALTAELLVVGHRRRNRLAALGSTAHGVLHRTSCPLLVVPVGPSAGQ